MSTNLAITVKSLALYRGLVRNVTWEDIEVHNVTDSAILFDFFAQNGAQSSADKQLPAPVLWQHGHRPAIVHVTDRAPELMQLSNVTVRNVRVSGAGRAGKLFCGNGSSACTALRFENISIVDAADAWMCKGQVFGSAVGCNPAPCIKAMPLKTEDDTWSGPALHVEHTKEGGFPALLLADDAAPSVPIPPFWLNLNNQGFANVSAITVQIIRAREAGLKLMTVVLSDALVVPPVADPTKQIMDLVALHHPAAKLLVRWYMSRPVLDHPEWKIGLQNTNGSTDIHEIVAMNSPTTTWATVAAANLSLALAGLDAAYPGRIAGVVLEGLEAGEWNMPPADASLPNGWMAGDYSANMATEFCAAEDPARRGATDCRLPTAAERNTATLGNALLQWRSGSDVSARSYRYNRFISQRVAGAIKQLAAAVKQVTKGKVPVHRRFCIFQRFIMGLIRKVPCGYTGKSLTMAFSGYLFGLSDSRLTGSAHLDLSSLLADINLDTICSPYQYLTAARVPAGRFTSHGPVDSLTLHKKLYISEDDSRTVLADKGGWERFANTTVGTVNLIRRNMYTSMLHKQGLYWLDLDSKGWWGRDDNATMVAATDAIWGNASHVLKQWQGMLGSSVLQASLLPRAEVAIFVDEISAAARPLLGRGGTIPLGFQFETRLQMHPWQDLAGIGAPVRVYLQSDLLHANFRFEELKVAVFLNAFMLGAELRQVIKTKLQRDGRTVAWLYAPGLLDADACTGSGSCMPSVVASSELVGLPLEMNSTVEVALTTTFEQTAPAGLAGSAFGAPLGLVSPFLYCLEGKTGVEVLGRYGLTAGSKASVCSSHSTTSNFTAVFIGAPRPPTAFWRTLAEEAGVHLFTDGSTTDDEATGAHADAVEAAASGLLFHAGAGEQSGRQRRVTLPSKLLVKSEFSEVVCSEPCDSFLTPPLAEGESILYWVSAAAAVQVPAKSR